MKSFHAHSENDTGRKELVAAHLRETAVLAKKFSSVWNEGEEGEVAGLLHDLGKYTDLFQKVLDGKAQKIDHATPGSQAALRIYGNNGMAAALAIEGHHDGLQTGIPQELSSRVLMKEPVSLLGKTFSSRDVDTLLGHFKQDGLSLPQGIRSDYPDYYVRNHRIAAMLYVRMLFSALVDADFLATEAHFNSKEGGYSYRPAGEKLEPDKMLKILLEHIRSLSQTSTASCDIRSLRNDLFKACLQGGNKPRGVYTLTAPTGSGKTLSMLAYALKHAATHSLRRIIIVLPYLSILEQNAQVYGRVFSSLADRALILEDHSLSDLPEEQRLLAENWDAPIIITTTVRFFEGLFANRSSSCRRLHNIAKSVILFDEAQSMPLGLTVYSLAAMSQLVRRYGCSVTFATATQPAFETLHTEIGRYAGSGWQPKEIVPQQLKLFQRNRKVRVKWENHLPWEQIAEKLAGKQKVLAVLNTRKQAKELYDLVADLGGHGDAFHLSTTMCPAHRLEIIKTVGERLKKRDSRCRLISTQCIEAGVDIDFPNVWRALGPLESISQAAGRCNREGLREYGRLTVFQPPPEDDVYPDTSYQKAAIEVKLMLSEKAIDIGDPDTIKEYYRRYFKADREKIGAGELPKAIQAFDFVHTAREYRWIPSRTINILVPYEAQIDLFTELCHQARDRKFNREWLKRARHLAVGYWVSRSGEISDFLEPVLNRRGEATGWYILLFPEAYSSEIGLEVERLTGDDYLI